MLPVCLALQAALYQMPELQLTPTEGELPAPRHRLLWQLIVTLAELRSLSQLLSWSGLLPSVH